MSDNRRPMASYRLQFNQGFTFSDALSLVPYFSRLGVTHVYASPILRARQTSTHGYDVVDPATINPNLGDKTDLVGLVTALQNYGLRLMLDIVPNHMATSIENPYWRDVLTYGPSSPFAPWFDIDWRLPDRDLWGRVIVPVLGSPLQRIIERDQIKLDWADGRFLVQYYEHVFPVDPTTVPRICASGMPDLEQRLADDPTTLRQIADILSRLKKLPKLAARLRRRAKIDRDETERWLAELAQIVVRSPRIQQWAEQTAADFGLGQQGHARLRKLLDAQPYRLVYWREAARAINYRRFFDINELISVRQENPQVFAETHAAVLRWVEDGLVDGLRIDHIDGLRDPLGYLERLSDAVDGNGDTNPLPIFVEKILAADERLPRNWPVYGSTGYEFLIQTEALFVAPEGFAELEQFYRRMLRRPVTFNDVALWGKRRVLRNDLSAHIGRLADILLRLAESSRATLNVEPDTPAEAAAGSSSLTAGMDTQGSAAATVAAPPLADRREFTKRELVDALVEVVAALPVYRTYVDSSHRTVSDADRHYIETAIAGAHSRGRATPESLDFVRQVLLLENHSSTGEQDVYECVNFVQRFQQLTGPAAAKGIEDTALYAYVPLVSLNEVGGEPVLPTAGAAATLHRANEERIDGWPRSMLSVTTHDTKRTADVRARLDVLSEIPKLWAGLVRRWHRSNKPHRSRVGGKNAPDFVAEYLFYQSVVGLWPAPDRSAPQQLPDSKQLREFRERIENYMIKAVREAKMHTSWTNNNQAYEDALVSFVRSLLLDDGGGANPFLADVQNFVARIARPGFWNSISRTLIHFLCPGSPDLYQGDELWNFALVDPDNRQPVDYSRRGQLLDEIIVGIESDAETWQALLGELVEKPEDGRIKLHTIRAALAARREYPDLFAEGGYVSLAPGGERRDHLFAFARLAADHSPTAESDTGAASSQKAAIVVVPRLTVALTSDVASAPIGESTWTTTAIELPEYLQGRTWRSWLTRELLSESSPGQLSVGQLLRDFPAALLIG